MQNRRWPAAPRALAWALGTFLFLGTAGGCSDDDDGEGADATLGADLRDGGVGGDGGGLGGDGGGLGGDGGGSGGDGGGGGGGDGGGLGGDGGGELGADGNGLEGDGGGLEGDGSFGDGSLGDGSEGDGSSNDGGLEDAGDSDGEVTDGPNNDGGPEGDGALSDADTFRDGGIVSGDGGRDEDGNNISDSEVSFDGTLGLPDTSVGPPDGEIIINPGSDGGPGPGPGPGFCGDGICDPSEMVETCPIDCPR